MRGLRSRALQGPPGRPADLTVTSVPADYKPREEPERLGGETGGDSGSRPRVCGPRWPCSDAGVAGPLPAGAWGSWWAASREQGARPTDWFSPKAPKNQVLTW